MEIKILEKSNQIINNLNIKLNFKNKKRCFTNIYNNFKIKLVNDVYSRVSNEIIIHTFLYLYYEIGYGLFVHIKNDKLKFLYFLNPKIYIKHENMEPFITKYYKFIQSTIKSFASELIFFVNLSEKPVLFKDQSHLKENNYKYHIPILSFSTSFINNDISIPFMYDLEPENKPQEKEYLFVFEESNLINKSSISNQVLNKLLTI